MADLFLASGRLAVWDDFDQGAIAPVQGNIHRMMRLFTPCLTALFALTALSDLSDLTALSAPAPAQPHSGDGFWQAEIDNAHLVIRDQATGDIPHDRPLVARDHALSSTAAIMAHDTPPAFLVALGQAPELWLVALDADAGPYHQGFVHSYIAGMEESLSQERGRFARLRIDLSAPLIALRPDPDDRRAVQGIRANGTCIRIHLVAKREIGPCLKGDNNG